MTSDAGLHEDKDSRHISRRAVQGVAWNFLAYGLGRGGVLLTTSILARLLSKEDFGLVAVAGVAIAYLSIVKDLGLGVALIQRRGDVRQAANTVFTVNLLLGIALSALASLLAPLFALYFRDPMVTPVLRWLGLSFFINALGAVHIVLLMRELDYRRKFLPDAGNIIVKSGTSIGLAFAGYGAWALVFGQLAGALASLVLVWFVFPWRPRLRLDISLFRSLLRFGASVTGTDVLSVITENLDYVIVGRVAGLAALSVYTLAYRLPEMLLIGNLWVMGRVVFPAFSRIQDRVDDMRRGFLASVRVIELLAVPVCLGLIIAAEPIVRVVFGERWLDAIPILRVLALYAWVYSIGYHIGGVYKAIGRPDILLKLSLLTLAVIVPALLIGARFGLVGVAWGHLIAVLIRRAVGLTVAGRFLKISVMRVLAELRPALFGALAMTPPTLLALHVTRTLNPFMALAIVVLTGALIYLGVIWWIERENLLRLARAVGVLGKAA